MSEAAGMLAAAGADASVWHDLLLVTLYGLGAGVGIVVLFSVALRGLILGAAARREGRANAALAWGAVGVVGVAACSAAVVLGLVTMLSR